MPSKQADTSKLDDQLAGHDFCQRLCLVKLPNNDNNPDERPSSGRRPRTWGKVESHKLWPAIKFNSQGELLAQIKKTVEKKHAMALCRWSATEIARERRTSNLTAKETMEFGVAYLLGPRSRFRPAFVWLTGNYNGKESEQVFDFYTHYFEMEDALGEHCGSRELQAAFKLAARRMVESSNVEVSTQPRQKTRESKSKKKGAIEKGKSRSAINEAVPVKMVVFSAANGSGSVSSPESPPFAGADEWHSEAARESTTVETTNVNNSVSKHSNRLESQFKYSAQTDSPRHTEMASRVKKGNMAAQAQAFKAVEAKPVLKAKKSHAKNAAEVNNKKSRKRPFGELVQSVNALDRTKRQAILDKAEENEKSMSLINEAPPVKMVVFSAENGSGSVSSPEKPSFTDDEVFHSKASSSVAAKKTSVTSPVRERSHQCTSTLDRAIHWREMWEKMKLDGWTYMKGWDLFAWVYLHPTLVGKKKHEILRDGKEGDTYFMTEEAVKRYAMRKLGWKSADVFDSQSSVDRVKKRKNVVQARAFEAAEAKLVPDAKKNQANYSTKRKNKKSQSKRPFKSLVKSANAKERASRLAMLDSQATDEKASEAKNSVIAEEKTSFETSQSTIKEKSPSLAKNLLHDEKEPSFADDDEWHSEATSTAAKTNSVTSSFRKLSYLCSPAPDRVIHWTEMWEKMKLDGWSYKMDWVLFRWIYLHPTLAGKEKHEILRDGKEGDTYFTSEEAVKRYAVRELGWKSLDPVDSQIADGPKNAQITNRVKKRRRAVQGQAAMAVETKPVPEAKKRQAKNDAKVTYKKHFQGPVSKATERTESQAMLTSQQSDKKASKAKESVKAGKKKSANVSHSASHKQRNTAVSTSSAETNADISPSVPAAQGSLVTSLSGSKQKSAEVTIIKEEHRSNKTSHIDWDKETNLDQHFGMENCNAGKSYNNSGRTEVVWKTIVAYGFRRTPNNKFKGLVPHPCFEHFVRDQVKKDSNILANGEIVSNCISDLAGIIRASHHINCLDEKKESICNMDDDDLVKEALSTGGIDGTDLYYSFCQGRLAWASQSRHCRICHCCMDSHNWHCKGCNECRQGIISAACPKCSPVEYLLEKNGDWPREARI